METKRIGKYLRVVRLPQHEINTTCVWQVLNNDDVQIGRIEWNWTDWAWRQYVFQPKGDAQYSARCLDDIAKFLRENCNTWKEDE